MDKILRLFVGCSEVQLVGWVWKIGSRSHFLGLFFASEGCTVKIVTMCRGKICITDAGANFYWFFLDDLVAIFSEVA